MCGIAGVISAQEFHFNEQQTTLMSYRGPDHTGTYIKQVNNWHVSLLHHRLSIIDLSNAAHQPYCDESGRYVLIFNGEIYNYLELKDELQKSGIIFHTHSDTEVLMKALILYGVKALEKLNGMFAFAFLDQKDQTILLARDPFGEKPLYYYHQDQKLIFASEIKFILACTHDKFSINGSVLGDYFSSHYLSAREKETFFDGIYKIPAGSYCLMDLKNQSLPAITTYKYYRPSIEHQLSQAFQEKTQTLKDLIESSVEMRLRSDVPVGLFLSGGIDSSILAAVSAKICQRNQIPLTLLSVVSNDPSSDESSFIDIVCQHLNLRTEKINITSSAKESWELLPHLTFISDEPLNSFASVSYFKMIEKAKSLGLKVMLTGQGADEAFLGYKKFKFWHYKNLLKQGKLLHVLKNGICEITNSDLLSSFTIAEALRYSPKGASQFKTFAWGSALKALKENSGRSTDNLKQIQYDDLVHFSVPFLLHYEDRFSMAHSCEVRVPFLDTRIVDFAMSLPDQDKINKGYSKYILRKSFAVSLPESILYRKDKKGFTIPQTKWMQQDLRKEIQDFFESDLLIYQLDIIDKHKNLIDYKKFCENKSRFIGFKDIFERISLEIWLKQFSSHLKMVRR